MNNFLRVMALTETELHRVVFISAREEGGINSLYDPQSEQFAYQVFIHNRFPYLSAGQWEFANFVEARSFAAKKFNEGWELLSWDQNVKRPCADGGTECGSGSCPTCASFKHDGKPHEGSEAGSCGGCGHA